ncbi:MAG: hypothetical protein ACT4OP_07515, partial [Actinomycetota bacterium]
MEEQMALRMVGRATYLAVPVIGLCWMFRGAGGAMAGAIGLAVVVGNVWLAGQLLSLGIRRSLTMYHAAALFGFILRMALIAGTMLLVVRFVEI